MPYLLKKKGVTLKSLHTYLSIIVAFIILGLSCTIKDDNGNPITNPNQNTPTIDPNAPIATPALFASADSAYVKIRDTINIRIRIIADSSLRDPVTPLGNVKVSGVANRGKLISDSIVVDRDGRGIFRFTDTTTGSVEVTFRCNGAVQLLRFDVSNTPVQIQKLMLAEPERSILLADGKDSTIISVRVLNSYHNPIAGECVQFLTTAGVIIGNGGCTGSGQSITGADGIAKAKLISSTYNDTAFVTAYLVSDRSLSDEFDVAFSGVSIKMTSDISNMVANDTAVITAKLLNGSNLPIVKSPISISLKSNTSSVLRILSKDSVTNYEGIATIRVLAVANGSDQVIAMSSGATGTLQLNVSTLSLRVTVDKTVIQTLESDSAVLTAKFSNALGQSLADRTIKLVKSYKSEEGTDTSETISKNTNAQGLATFTISSLSYEGIMRLEATGFDRTDGSASADTQIQFITTRVMTIRAPEFVAADGSSKGAVTVTIKNRSGNPVINDAVIFSTTAGTITAQAKTDENGKATAYITSDRRNIVATITAKLKSDPTKQQSISVVFSGVQINATVKPLCISSSGKDTAVVTTILVDAANNPIAGEPINFAKQKEATTLVFADSITNNRGEAISKFVGTGSGVDTLKITAAGATTPVSLFYSSNVLLIDTIAGQAFVANGKDSTRFVITYLQGNRITPIPNTPVQLNVTLGFFDKVTDTLFAKAMTTDANGKLYVSVHNPSFAGLATVSALAISTTELTFGFINLQYRASKVKKIKLIGTSEVIPINGGRGKIIATAYDSLGNRVQDARIAFNLLEAPSGSAYLDPPSAITSSDGSATTFLVAGKTPSKFRQVLVWAEDFNKVVSDTVKFTFVGPPEKITVRPNLLKGKNPNDGTFILPCAAIVTDINGNPVADGTDVTFSLQISGYQVFERIWSMNTGRDSLGMWNCWATNYIDSIFFPYEDLNDNMKLDIGEDRNNNGILNRGEDVNGDGKYIRGPAYEDINHNGKRDYDFYENTFEPYAYQCDRLIDLNGNRKIDLEEPLVDSVSTEWNSRINVGKYMRIYKTLQDNGTFAQLYHLNHPTLANPLTPEDSLKLRQLDTLRQINHQYTLLSEEYNQFDRDAEWNGVADPHTAVSIRRTIQTTNGVATNEIIYGQTDATKIEITVWAEAQGIRSIVPATFILPIIKD
jgi:hypothetical protein